MKKKSKSELAREYGLDPKSIDEYIAAGVDVWDRDKVEIHRITLGGCQSIGSKIDEDELEPLDKEEFLRLKLKKLVHETALKESEAILKDLDVQTKKERLISIDEVAEMNTLIGSKVKAQLKSLILTLPPKLEGLQVKQMSKVIEESISDILEFLFSELNIEDD